MKYKILLDNKKLNYLEKFREHVQIISDCNIFLLKKTFFYFIYLKRKNILNHYLLLLSFIFYILIIILYQEKYKNKIYTNFLKIKKKIL